MRALVEQPGAVHSPLAPCLWQSPRAYALVEQPGAVHSVLIPPPCLTQSPRVCALVVQPGAVHSPFPPCLPQSPRAAALVVHPSTVHPFLSLPLPCFALPPLGASSSPLPAAPPPAPAPAPAPCCPALGASTAKEDIAQGNVGAFAIPHVLLQKALAGLFYLRTCTACSKGGVLELLPWRFNDGCVERCSWAAAGRREDGRCWVALQCLDGIHG